MKVVTKRYIKNPLQILRMKHLLLSSQLFGHFCINVIINFFHQFLRAWKVKAQNRFKKFMRRIAKILSTQPLLFTSINLLFFFQRSGFLFSPVFKNICNIL